MPTEGLRADLQHSEESSRPSCHEQGLGMQFEGPTVAGLMYSDTGGDGPVVVLLHGVLMNGTLWDTVVDGLRDRYRCIVPELPFGAHTTPMPDDADLSLPALATMIAEFLTELDLHHVTVVCNDWGGAQLLISPGGTELVANLVLVSCEVFDNYPPGVPGRLLCLNAALPGGTFGTAQLLRPRWIRHLPVTIGALSKRRVPETSERRPYRSRAAGALEVVACRRYLGGEGGTVQDHEKVSGPGHRNEEL